MIDEEKTEFAGYRQIIWVYADSTAETTGSVVKE